MSATEVILSLECSLLALFLLLMIGALILYKWKNTGVRNQNGPRNDSTKANYVILPHTNAQPVQLERNVKQVNPRNTENDESADHPLIDERTDAGRLYFSLKYDEKISILTIKLIKGENLPKVTKGETNAFVSVGMISDQKTEDKENPIIGTIYQRTYKFPVPAKDFASRLIRFEISRFDRFSRKYDVGYCTVSLADLKSRAVDMSREAFFNRNISPYSKTSKADIRKRKHPDRPEKSQALRRVRKESKVKQRRPQALWHKLSHAVHAGLYQGLLRGRHESLQWDPFLIIQKYEYADSDESCSPPEQQTRKRHHEFSEEEIPELFPKVFNSSVESPAVSNHSDVQSDSSSDTAALQTPVNREFYRLVHSPVLSQSDSAEPVTSWSIPETFRFPPSPVRLQSSTVLFQSAPAACQTHHDRLHKLTSLSSNYRKRILRKSRRRATFGRSKITRLEPLHRLLYLGKETRTERTRKRLRGEEPSCAKN